MDVSKLSYKKYLKSQHWRLFMAYALNFYENKCAICGADSLLEVHHWTYERVGMERLDDVSVVCAFCHENIHDVADISPNIVGIVFRQLERLDRITDLKEKKLLGWTEAEFCRVEERVNRLFEKAASVYFVSILKREFEKGNLARSCLARKINKDGRHGRA